MQFIYYLYCNHKAQFLITLSSITVIAAVLLCFGVNAVMYPAVFLHLFVIVVLLVALMVKKDKKKYYNQFVLLRKNLCYVRDDNKIFSISNNKVYQYDTLGSQELDEMTLIPFFIKPKYNLDKFELLIQFSLQDNGG
jgi:hypothetical protein